MTNLTVIVDPAFEGKETEMAKDRPIWIVNSGVNSAVAANLRRLGYAVTTYQCSDVNDRLMNLRSILTAAELHHGGVSGDEIVFQDGTNLEVAGLRQSDASLRLLKDFGFTQFTETANGFGASK